jgi:hypothetical protein
VFLVAGIINGAALRRADALRVGREWVFVKTTSSRVPGARFLSGVIVSIGIT